MLLLIKLGRKLVQTLSHSQALQDRASSRYEVHLSLFVVLARPKSAVCERRTLGCRAYGLGEGRGGTGASTCVSAALGVMPSVLFSP